MTEPREQAESEVFDRAWYLRRYQDVAAAGKDPLQHFIEFDWTVGRYANSCFDPTGIGHTIRMSRQRGSIIGKIIEKFYSDILRRSFLRRRLRIRIKL